MFPSTDFAVAHSRPRQNTSCQSIDISAAPSAPSDRTDELSIRHSFLTTVRPSLLFEPSLAPPVYPATNRLLPTQDRDRLLAPIVQSPGLPLPADTHRGWQICALYHILGLTCRSSVRPSCLGLSRDLKGHRSKRSTSKHPPLHRASFAYCACISWGPCAHAINVQTYTTSARPARVANCSAP